MGIANLLRVMRAPQKPAEIPTQVSWRETAKRIGELPSDYRAFLEAFGTGSFSDFLWILNPVSANVYLNLFHEMDAILGALRELRDSGEPCPYPIYPESGGLLPFGTSDNGDALFWITSGKPDEWVVVVNSAREPTYERFAVDMTSFLAGILTRQFRCTIFPDSFPSGPPKFVPSISSH